MGEVLCYKQCMRATQIKNHLSLQKDGQDSSLLRYTGTRGHPPVAV